MSSLKKTVLDAISWKTRKEKNEVRRKAKIESDKIFMKIRPDQKQKGSNPWPEINRKDPAMKEYNTEASKLQKQVEKTRMKQYKAKKKNK